MELTKGDIVAAVDRKIYNRGLDYMRGGRVMLRDVSEGRARAVVHGSENYVADFVFANGRFKGACTCPYSNGERICKHVVAVGLAYLEDMVPREDSTVVLKHLETFSKAELINLVMDQSVRDPSLFDSLLVQAVVGSAPGKALAYSLSSVARTLTKERSCLAGDNIQRLVRLFCEHLERNEPGVVLAAAEIAVSSIDEHAANIEEEELEERMDGRRYEYEEYEEYDDEDVEESADDPALPIICVLVDAERMKGDPLADVAKRAIAVCESGGSFAARFEIYEEAFGEALRASLKRPRSSRGR